MEDETIYALCTHRYQYLYPGVFVHRVFYKCGQCYLVGSTDMTCMAWTFVQMMQESFQSCSLSQLSWRWKIQTSCFSLVSHVNAYSALVLYFLNGVLHVFRPLGWVWCPVKRPFVWTSQSCFHSQFDHGWKPGMDQVIRITQSIPLLHYPPWFSALPHQNAVCVALDNGDMLRCDLEQKIRSDERGSFKPLPLVIQPDVNSLFPLMCGSCFIFTSIVSHRWMYRTISSAVN